MQTGNLLPEMRLAAKGLSMLMVAGNASAQLATVLC
jgi:hypothetical protein